ncbi:MAG: ATP-dependent RNA helicase HrpA, partial [Mycobacteriales bacterium]
LMTDGILLAEIARDRNLSAYDTLVIDEAHERSLNIDFLLGLLKQLLARRPDLKLVITSATIDPQRFAEYFGGCPIVEVSGRSYPVEVRYRPLAADGREERDQLTGIADAVLELRREPIGDILVFLSGEREIRDAADQLSGLQLPATEILPLYARLSAAEQHRVFARHPDRRVVLATNVAETSLTVPGIRYVVDAGTARISRYSVRNKVQRLPIEAISQASSWQRAGRCGRVADGVCIRLYSEEDFHARPAFTDPEILRTNLASVILQMASLGLGGSDDASSPGGIAEFPFLDPPDRRQITDGVALLEELGALDIRSPDPRGRLTPLGRRLAGIPVDPRIGRMILEAGEQDCLDQVLIIAAALSIQDPRERPADKQQQADEAHRRYADPTSDFAAYLNLWDHVRDRQRELTSSGFRRMCRSEFLNYLRVREWQDLVGQLRQVARELSLHRSKGLGDPDAIHRSLLSGLLSHIGQKEGETREFLGARGTRFMVFPGSGLAKKPPRFVMAAELVETSRLWARDVARIDPLWAESLAPQLVKRTHSEPRWDRKRGAVVATERVTLYGVPLVTGRVVLYGDIDRESSRELFIRHALVEGDWQTHHPFFAANQALLDEVTELEDRSRRRDIVVDDATLFRFYDERVGPDAVSTRHFDSWWKEARLQQPDLLTFTRELLTNATASAVTERDYPDTWRYHDPGGGAGQDIDLQLAYRFEPGAPADGVTVEIPLGVLNRVAAEPFQWQVPGFREPLVTALVRALPKQIRRSLVLVPDHVRALLARVRPNGGPLLLALESELHALSGVDLPPGAWSIDAAPPHLRMTFRVLDAGGTVIGEGKDLHALQQELAAPMQAAIAHAGTGMERTGMRSWEIESLPAVVTRRHDGHDVRGFAALVDEGDSVGVAVLPDPAQAQVSHWLGTRRLILLALPSPHRALQRSLPNNARLALRRNPYGELSGLLDDVVACAVDALVIEAGGAARDARGFAGLVEHIRPRLPEMAAVAFRHTLRILQSAAELERAVTGLPESVSRQDLTAQLAALVYPGFLTGTGLRRLPDVARYLDAAIARAARVRAAPGRDAIRLAEVAAVTAAYQQARVAAGHAGTDAAALREVGWMIQELRVSLFAQQIGTAYPVSSRRIHRRLAEIGGP